MTPELVTRLKNGDLPLDFNWNRDAHADVSLPTLLPAQPTARQIQRVELVAEDLRDGLHGIARYPCVEAMLAHIGALVELGITTITVGIFPGTKSSIDEAIRRLLAALRDMYPQVTPIVLCLTSRRSIKWLFECKDIHPKLQAIVFMGTAPSRFLVEEWDTSYVLSKLSRAIEEVTRYGIRVIGATEHTTQTPPDLLRAIIRAQFEHGASSFCIADTIGIARPLGVLRIVRFVRQVLDKLGFTSAQIDWHGHRDLGNDVANALMAIVAGANRVHTVARGIGERAGNTQLEALLLNCDTILREEKVCGPWRLEYLQRVLESYDALTEVPAPYHGPLSRRSHSTSLGIHTAAMLKATTLARTIRTMGNDELATRLEAVAQQVYTAVDPERVGRKHSIYVGPWSGTSTVRLAYAAYGGNPDALPHEMIERILATAERCGRELSDVELRDFFERVTELEST